MTDLNISAKLVAGTSKQRRERKKRGKGKRGPTYLRPGESTIFQASATWERGKRKRKRKGKAAFGASQMRRMRKPCGERKRERKRKSS